jgi:6-phosphofructokinase 1
MSTTGTGGRIAVLTSGGDAPGMNAAIRAAVRTAIGLGAEAVGVEHGFEGLIARRMRPFTLGDVGGILDRGGTFLGTSRSEHFRTPGGLAEAAGAIRSEGITGVVVIGGEGSYKGGLELHKRHGVAVACVPGTIDNDVDGTDACIGFDTALNTIADAVTKVRDTASSHERTFVIEVMGRTSGFLALYAGLACGADYVLLPEMAWKVEDICATIESGIRRGKKHAIVMTAEGAAHAFTLAEDLSKMCGQDVRSVVLGHVQRGGAPSAFDRILGSRMASHAVHSLIHGEEAFAVGLRCADTVSYSIADAVARTRPLPPDLEALGRILAR